jgi:hypothetical protein
VFISHDHRDSVVAASFAKLLTGAGQGTVRAFSSSDCTQETGIEFGADWFGRLKEEMNQATAVVALLTENSVQRPWILYEAGLATVKLGNVIGVALGIPLSKVKDGPFTVFRNSSDSEESLTALVLQLLARNRDAQPDTECVSQHVREFRATLSEKLTGPAATPLFLTESPDQRFRNALSGANVVYLVGVSLTKDLAAFQEPLETTLTKRPEFQLKILVAKPEKAVVLPAVLRRWGPDALKNDDSFTAKIADIKTSLDLAHRLQDKAPAQVEVLTTGYPLGYGIRAINPWLPSGVLFVKIYCYRKQGRQKPTLELRADDDRRPFEEELRMLWKDSRKEYETRRNTLDV